MNKQEFNKGLINFISKSTCSYTCINEIKKTLDSNGYKELYEIDNNWRFDCNKYYVVRNDASIIAFDIPKDFIKSFNIITTHSDTPSLLLKANGSYVKHNYLKYNVMPYGGLLNFGWLDHLLSISGRVVTKNNNKINIKIIDYEKPMAIIPSVAIHQNDQANINLDLNMQTDLQPILCISNKDCWQKILNKKIKGIIMDYDLFLYNPAKPVIINNDILVSPRIDNLTSVYSSLISFIEAKSSNIKVFCSFNNEEIGSLTQEGADSNFLIDILKRICATLNIDISSTLASSFIISSDNTHAIHPNHDELSDETSKIYMGKGFTIIKEMESTTNAISSSIIKTICDKNKIKYQYETAKNDIMSGSTLSSISLRHVSILSIDVGIAQLSMHSSTESCSINDVYELYKMMNCFYETIIINDKNGYKII